MQTTLQPNHSLLHLEKEEDQAGNNQQPLHTALPSQWAVQAPNGFWKDPTV